MDIDELFEFEECEKGYILKDYLLKNDPSVTEAEIPSEYKGKPVTIISSCAFFASEHLRRVKIPDGITTICNLTFGGCDDLKTVILPSGLKKIGSQAFSDCEKLENIIFPDGLEVIEDCAFSSCLSLKTVILPDSVKKIGDSAFFRCTNLTSVVLPKNLTEISQDLFDYCLSLSHIELPDSIREIGDLAFDQCGLTSVKLPPRLEYIGESAFGGCDITSVTFPSTLKKIGREAFGYCIKLEKADFGDSTPLLEKGVFNFCERLRAENFMQGLAGSVDFTKPFQRQDPFPFDWDTALREDVFVLAMKYNSFALFDKGKVMAEIISRELVQFLPLVENAGWDIADIMEKHFEELLEISMKKGFTETTAWLLDYKNRKLGFGKA
ncbi:MAG: leucine-rich repeat domain-containing protein [Ruminiclostridium sp.]|nr:leucine-rich repeat domain-containing protein [Ruminiclostridium sp.]